MAPWTYQGKYPYYMTFVLNQMVYKNGGIEASRTSTIWCRTPGRRPR